MLKDTKWIQHKKLICFGSGSYFQIMYYDFKDRYAGFRIHAIIDNNPEKVGKYLMIDKDSIPILSIYHVMEKYRADEIVVMITTAFHKEVMEQLKKYDYFKQVEIVSYYELKKSTTKPYFELDTFTDKPIIPKKIHYCWFGGKRMPAHLQREVDNWHRLCPEYEFICWNESNYNIDKIAYTRHAYENKMWGHLPDYVRLDVIYNHGGIYMDTDVELLYSLESLRSNYAFFGTEVTGGINEGSGFGALEGHEFIKELMSVYENMDVKNPLHLSTSLGKEIGIFHKHGYKNNGEYQVIDGVTIYPYHVLAPMIKETGECMKTDATIGIHHFEGSWCR